MEDSDQPLKMKDSISKSCNSITSGPLYLLDVVY